jgi:hypothetical protein
MRTAWDAAYSTYRAAAVPQVTVRVVLTDGGLHFCVATKGGAGDNNIHIDEVDPGAIP